MELSGPNIIKLPKMSSYILGNKTPEKDPYISGNGNPKKLLIYQKMKKTSISRKLFILR